MNPIVIRRMMTLAALLASILMAACGLGSANSSSETLTVYEDAPTLTHLDLGPPGNSGQLTSTRNADGTYTQVFTLLK